MTLSTITQRGKLLLEGFLPAGVERKAAIKQAAKKLLDLAMSRPLREAQELLSEAFGSAWFANITLDAVNKALIEGYGPEPLLFMPLVRERTARDFRTQYEIARAAFPDLEKVDPGEPYRVVTIGDEKASWSIAKYGNLFPLDMEAIANDELGALLDGVREWGEAAKRTKQAWFFTTNLEGNPTLYDAVTLFHATHNNLLTTTPLSDAGLASGIAKLRRQTGRNGEKIHLQPKWLVVPPDLEQTAKRLVMSETLIVSKQLTTSTELTGAQNTFRGLGLEVVVTPYLSSVEDWYLFAATPGFVFGQFSGQAGPQTFREVVNSGAEFEADVQRFKVRDFWGGTWRDYRTVVKGDAS